MPMSSSAFALVPSYRPVHRGAPALRVRQDPRQPQRLRLSGSFGEVCRALDALLHTHDAVALSVCGAAMAGQSQSAH